MAVCTPIPQKAPESSQDSKPDATSSLQPARAGGSEDLSSLHPDATGSPALKLTMAPYCSQGQAQTSCLPGLSGCSRVTSTSSPPIPSSAPATPVPVPCARQLSPQGLCTCWALQLEPFCTLGLCNPAARPDPGLGSTSRKAPCTLTGHTSAYSGMVPFLSAPHPDESPQGPNWGLWLLVYSRRSLTKEGRIEGSLRLSPPWPVLHPSSAPMSPSPQLLPPRPPSHPPHKPLPTEMTQHSRCWSPRWAGNRVPGGRPSLPHSQKHPQLPEARQAGRPPPGLPQLLRPTVHLGKLRRAFVACQQPKCFIYVFSQLHEAGADVQSARASPEVTQPRNGKALVSPPPHSDLRAN